MGAGQKGTVSDVYFHTPNEIQDVDLYATV